MNVSEDNIIYVEQTILGSILKDCTQFEKIIHELVVTDFHHPLHKDVFSAMVQLHEVGKPIDFFTVGDILKPTYPDTTIWEYGKEMVDIVPNPLHVDTYLSSLKTYGKRKQLSASLNKLDKLNVSEQPLGEIIELGQQDLLLIGSDVGIKKNITLKDAMTEFLDEIINSVDGQHILKLKTHYSQLDALLQGIRPGNFVVVAGRPSSGKTTFVLNVIRNILLYQQKAIQLFSFEMSQTEIVRSLLAMTGSIPIHQLKDDNISDSNMLKMRYALEQLKDAKIDMHFTGSTISNVKKQARAFRDKNQKDAGLIVIDYLQLMSKPRSENRVMEITAITRELKLLAQELQLPIIALSQLNRNSDNGVGVREPRLSDLRDSGSIEQDADIVIFIHRALKETTAKIMVAKNRSGVVNDIYLTFDGNTATFKEQGYGVR